MQDSVERTQHKRLVVGLPNIMDRSGFLHDVDEILDTRIFTNNGPFATKLEQQISSFLGVKYTIAVSNATVGIAMVLRALNLEPGGEVILPGYTFIATAHAVYECGLKPVFCDCDPSTHLIREAQISKCLSRNTVAILAVNLWGLACEVDELETLAAQRNIALVFDSAHSFGARTPTGKFVGNFGKAEVFSMHATKLFNSFEGGIITTNDDSLAELLLPMRNFGITGQDTVSCWGSNYKLSEVHAAFAIRQLQNIDALIAVYKRNAQSYAHFIKKIGLRHIRFWNEEYLSHLGCTHSYVCLEIQNSSVVSRDEMVSYLRENNIYAKRYFLPGVHKCRPYNADSVTLPTTESLCRQVLVLPTGSQVNEQDIERIVSLLKQAGDLKQHTKGLCVTTAISTDISHLADKRRYLELQKAKYIKLADECARDLDFVEEQLKLADTI